MSTRQYKVTYTKHDIRIHSYLDGELDKESYIQATLQLQPHGWYLHDLFVHPEHRGNGVGARLVKIMKREARMSGASRILLMPGGDNKQTIRRLGGWYRILGFTKIKSLDGGGWIMEWKVPKKT